MNTSLFQGLCPACIAFGPFFLSGQAISGREFHGVLLLTVGLCSLYYIVVRQQRTIRELRAIVNPDRETLEKG